MSREDLTEMLPTNIYVTNMLSRRLRNQINNIFHSLISLNWQTSFSRYLKEFKVQSLIAS
jgi:hypothetical protein